MEIEVRKGAEEWLWLSAVLALTVSTTIAAFWIGARVGIPTASIIDGYAYAVSLGTPIILIGAAAILTTRAALLKVESPIAASKPFLKSRFGSPALVAGTVTSDAGDASAHGRVRRPQAVHAAGRAILG